MHLCIRNPVTQKFLSLSSNKDRYHCLLLSWDREELLSLLVARTIWGHFQTRLLALRSTQVYTEMYLALDHFLFISLRRSAVNTGPRPWTLSRVGRAVNTKFVYGCSGKLARPRLVTFHQPELGIFRQAQASQTSRAVFCAQRMCDGAGQRHHSSVAPETLLGQQHCLLADNAFNGHSAREQGRLATERPQTGNYASKDSIVLFCFFSINKNKVRSLC